jgi:hypothetical protein
MNPETLVDKTDRVNKRALELINNRSFGFQGIFWGCLGMGWGF